MDSQEALEFTNKIDEIVFECKQTHLDDLHRSIILGTLQGLKYPAIAEATKRSHNHIKYEAVRLWKILSKVFGQEVKQSNIRSVIEKNLVSKVSREIVQILNIDIAGSNHTVCGNNSHGARDHPPLSKSDKSAKTYVDLNHIPQLSHAIPRLSEINTLQQYISNPKTRLITITGITGIGKTTLATQLISQLSANFHFIIWRNFQQPPTLADLQTDLIQTFTKHETPKLPTLLDYLISYRCLLILDNIENLFTPQQFVGNYQLPYQNYPIFWRQITQLSHASCVILISQEKLPEIDVLGTSDTVGNLSLNGLGDDAKIILQDYGLTDQELWSKLITIYDGHPLWLRLVAQTIKNLCHGSVAEFLEDEKIFLGDITNYLDRVMVRLSDQEKQVICLLGQTEGALTIRQMANQLNLTKSDLLQICQSLERRFLIENREGPPSLFTLKPILKTYQISAEWCVYFRSQLPS